MIRVLDLFSGIGGFSLGLESTGGFETIAFCEIEPFCREVLAEHWPYIPVFDDIRELHGSLGDVDMICGGFPCQDISVAGKGAGIEGERSELWSELFRLVREVRPRWVLVENVPALRTRGADRVLSDLEGAGYSCWPLVVGAWAVGAPHRRERIWIVARRTADAERGREGLLAGALGCEAGREGDAGEPQEPEPWDASMGNAKSERQRSLGAESERQRRTLGAHGSSPRWPARPGEPQHEWEEPRLADPARNAARGVREASGADRIGTGPTGDDVGDTAGRRRNGREASAQGLDADGGAAGRSEGELRDSDADRRDAEPAARSAQQPLGSAAHGLPERLARRANREALKALGNSVVPQVVAAIGRAILAVDSGL